MRRSRGNVPSKALKAKYTKILAAAAIVVYLAVSVFSDFSSFEKAYTAISRADGLFSVHFIDVGQGDASLLRSPDGKYMLVDCGTSSESDYLVKYLKNCGVETLEYLIITHPHEDHYGGAGDVIAEFPIENFVIHEDFADTYPYDRFINMLENSSFGIDTEIIETHLGETYEFADCAEFEIISPVQTGSDLNESSLCFKVEFGKTSFMFTGDAEKGSEKKMLSAGYDLSADILQAGHHGSSTSNSSAFVEAVNPEYVIVSCGKDNSYGHPHKEALEHFAETGAEVLRTDELGDIVFTSDGASVEYAEDFFDSDGGSSSKAQGNVFLAYIKSLFA